MGDFAEAAAALTTGGTAETGTAPAPSGGGSVSGGAPATGPPSGGARIGALRPTPAAPAAPASDDLHHLRHELGQLKQTYGWLPRDHVNALQQFHHAYTSDPVAALTGELLSAIRNNPVALQRFLSMAGGQLGVFPPAEEEAEPQGGDYTLADRSASFTSDGKLAERLAWREKQLEQRFQQAIQPFQTFMEETRTSQLETAMRERGHQNAQALFAEAAHWVGFNENRAAIGKAFQELSQKYAPAEAFTRAYLTVMQGELRKTMTQGGLARAQTLLAKPGASTSNPARPTSVTPGARPASFRDAAERLFGRKVS